MTSRRFRSVGSEHQETVGRLVVAEIVDDEWLFDGVVEVAIGAVVLAGRRVDFHGSIVLRMRTVRQPALPWSP